MADGTLTYRLHDLFHDLACNLLTASPKPKRKGSLLGLGITLPAAHAIFLEKHRNLTDKNLWHTLPSDGYIHQHLVWHLEKAEKIEEIHQLLAEESETGGNGWYEACDRLGHSANFVTDVANAWRLAEADWNEENLPFVVGLQCRYALSIASINALATIIPENLLFALINKNVWTPEEGLFYALRIQDPNQKARRLIALTNYLPEGLKEKALEELEATGYSVHSELNYNHSNYNYISLYSELLRFLERTRKKGKFACILRDLRNKKSSSERLNFLNKIENTDFRAIMFLLYMIRDKILESEISKSNSDIEVSKIESFKSIIPDIQGIQYKEIISDIKNIQNIEIRAFTLTALADKLPQIINDAFAYTKKIQDIKCLILLQDILVDKLPPELLLEARESVRYIQDKEYGLQLLGVLAGKQPQLLLENLEELEAIDTNCDDNPNVRALVVLANKQPQLLLEAFKAPGNIWDEEFRVQALAVLTDEQPQLLLEALEAVKNIIEEEFCVQTLVAF